jgi:hypothetical protein
MLLAKIRIYIVFSCLLLVHSKINAQDNLIILAADSFNTAYYDELFRKIHKGFNTKPAIRYTVCNTVTSEYAFIIEKVGEKYYIASNTLTENFRNSKSRSSIDVVSQYVSIPKSLFEAINKLIITIDAQMMADSISPSLIGNFKCFTITNMQNVTRNGLITNAVAKSRNEMVEKFAEKLYQLTFSNVATVKDLEIEANTIREQLEKRRKKIR